MSYKERPSITNLLFQGLEPESLMFRDGRRRIDMVLAYQEEDYGVMTENEARKREQRRVFQKYLRKEGLELELEDKINSFDENTWFLKIHLPWKTEMRLAEVNGMKLHTRRFIAVSNDGTKKETKRRWWSICRRWLTEFYEYDHSKILPEPSFYKSYDEAEEVLVASSNREIIIN
ncbi:hypothetical protein PYW07_011340 [Mythimna separata]|uniref:Anoctamin dimerisation domain-containing protein n=1 Tax=Mythimna separata TaxID=271217 RepID=A0AAD7Y9I3_MYTSE|nr:hypothetical protein PYW07_011340 [Mythimna separata]